MTARHDIVVIGASLGGLEALRKLASGFSADLPASIVAVVHTSKQSPMQFANILQPHTPLVVSYATQGEAMERGHLYFAPPDHHLRVVPPGHLILDQGPRDRFHRPSADVLFTSAAAAFGSRTIGVVLSGGDGDGTKGFWAIKRAGGVCVVQEPSEAQVPDMPLNAIIGDDPDYRLRLDAMAAVLSRLVEGTETPAGTLQTTLRER